MAWREGFEGPFSSFRASAILTSKGDSIAVELSSLSRVERTLKAFREGKIIGRYHGWGLIASNPPPLSLFAMDNASISTFTSLSSSQLVDSALDVDDIVPDKELASPEALRSSPQRALLSRRLTKPHPKSLSSRFIDYSFRHNSNLWTIQPKSAVTKGHRPFKIWQHSSEIRSPAQRSARWLYNAC
jgi:hypothetical protein